MPKSPAVVIVAAALLLVLAAVGAAACGGDSASSGSTATLSGPNAALYEKAREEPRLTWYTSADPGSNDRVIEAFRERYPDIEVEALRAPTGTLTTRYAQEREAGIVNAGLVTLADPVFIDSGLDEGWFVEMNRDELPALRDLPDRWFHRGAAVTGINPFGIAYNTQLLREDPPTTWEDLLDPRYRGEILFGDPRNVPAWMELMRIWRDELGPEFLRGFAAQDVVVVDSAVPANQQLAAGEAQLMVPDAETVMAPLVEEGAPIAFVLPDVTTGNEYTTVLSEGARTPASARLLYDFLFTKEGQAAFNGETSYSPLPAVAQQKPLPPGYVAPRITELDQSVQQELLGLLGLR